MLLGRLSSGSVVSNRAPLRPLSMLGSQAECCSVTLPSSLAVGIAVREQASLFAFDWAIITGKRSRRWIQASYFSSKIAWWAYVSLNIAMVYGRGPYSCEAMMISIEVLMAVVMLSSSVMLACRALCVFQGEVQRHISWLLVLGALFVTAAWLAGATDVDTVWIDQAANPWAVGSCTFKSVSIRHVIKYLVTILYDALVLGLTIFGVVRMSRNGPIPLGTVLVRQGIFYFLATFFANLLVLVCTALRVSPLLSLLFAVPSATVCLTASNRLYVQLAQVVAHRPQGISSDAFVTRGGTYSTTEKLIRFLRGSPSPRKGPVDDSFSGPALDDSIEPSLPYKQQDLVGSAGTGTTDSGMRPTYEIPTRRPFLPVGRSVSPLSREYRPVVTGPIAPPGSSSSTRPLRLHKQPNPTTMALSRSGTISPSPIAMVMTPSSSLQGVQVSQTRTQVEEPIPDYLVHPAFLTPEQLARVQPDSEEARFMAMAGGLAHHPGPTVLVRRSS